MTGYLEQEEKTIVLADIADATTFKKYLIGFYNISHGHSTGELDAGLIPYGTIDIACVVFEDTDADGVFANGEKPIEDETVYLDYAEVESAVAARSMSAEPSDYRPFEDRNAKTDGKGHVLFENLPILSPDGNPYRYRLRMEKPDGMEFTKSYTLEENSREKVNLLRAGTREDGIDSEDVGVVASALGIFGTAGYKKKKRRRQ